MAKFLNEMDQSFIYKKKLVLKFHIKTFGKKDLRIHLLRVVSNLNP